VLSICSYYSVSCSGLGTTPACERASICAAVLRYRALGRGRQGVCTTFLADRLPVGSRCQVWVNPNPDFRLPADAATPVVMLGPGTGVAPFRAFLQQRLLQQQAAGRGATGEHVLFFGCRRRDQDFLYGEELTTWHRRRLLKLVTAFSREGEGEGVGEGEGGGEGEGEGVGGGVGEGEGVNEGEGEGKGGKEPAQRKAAPAGTKAPKVYVQNRLAESGNAAAVWGLLHPVEGRTPGSSPVPPAHLYVCGDANHMAGDVQDELLRLIQTHGGRSAAEAQAYLDELSASGRYQRDIWFS
jgi:sulfite reductase (NADPH) flavoprotein alpha-component